MCLDGTWYAVPISEIDSIEMKCLKDLVALGGIIAYCQNLHEAEIAMGVTIIRADSVDES